MKYQQLGTRLLPVYYKSLYQVLYAQFLRSSTIFWYSILPCPSPLPLPSQSTTYSNSYEL
jgi:hypothetical protein